MSWPADGEPRFMVSELRGFREPLVGDYNGGADHFSLAVVDRAVAMQVVGEWASERVKGRPMMNWARHAAIRGEAAELAAELNAGPS